MRYVGRSKTRWPIRIGAPFIVAWSLAPFLWQLSTSFQVDKAITAAVPQFWPHPFTLVHFEHIFFVKHFQYYILNSVIVSFVTTVLALALGALAAFALSRLRIAGRFGLLGLILSVSMFPQIAIVGPIYLLAASLNLLNTYTILVIVYLALGLPLVIWVLFGYFNEIPMEIDESAKMDGAGPLRILFSIIVPMSLPGFVTTGLLAFIMAWNEFLFALAFTSDIGHQTIPVGIANFTNLFYVPWGDIAAASVVVTLPLVALVLFFQRHVIEGLTQGAVKE